MKLEGKVALVTGASSGIGKNVAMLYAKEGAKVVAVARRLENLEAIRDEVKDLGYPGEILPISVDLSNDDEIKAMVEKTLEEYGTIDILVNNAGILDEYRSVENIENELWDKVFSVNVDSIMKVTREVIPVMKENKSGSIINTTSVGGLHGMRGGLAYVASKHAVVGMTKNIGFTYADMGIRCNAIAPGNIATDISKTVKSPDMTVLNKLMKGFELLPVSGKTEEVAPAYLFLASDDGKFVNGTVLVVDGGWTAY